MEEEIHSVAICNEYKMSSRDFTRKRKLSFSKTLLFMLNFITKSLSCEIVNFIHYIRSLGQAQNTFTKSAYVQNRKKIKPEVFIHLNQRLVEEFYTDNSAVQTKYNGLRLLAIDGSRINLPQTRELEEIYGVSKNQTSHTCVQAKACVLYDTINKICLKGVLSSIDTDERLQALELLDHCCHNDLLLYDRGFASFDFFHQHHKRNLNYLMRVRVGLNQTIKDFVKSGKSCMITDLKPSPTVDLSGKDYSKDYTLKVRLLRVVLDNGTIEVLATSLLDETCYPSEIFKALYFERWGVETYFDEIKNKLHLEEFSGYSNNSILQDFYSTLLVSNIQTLIVRELEQELTEADTKKKYRYKVNTSLSYSLMKNRILNLLFSNVKKEDMVAELKVLFASHMIPIRPKRSFKRNILKYRVRAKPKVTKNYKKNL